MRYIFRNIFYGINDKSKKSPSNESEEMIALFNSCKTDTKPENQNLVFALDRGR